MPYLYLIRHPKTHVDPTRSPGEWRLSAEGQMQVDALANAPFWQGVSALYTSVQPKARRTAEIIATRYNIRLMLADEFSEVYRGTEVFRTLAEHHILLREFFAKPDEAIAGWETGTAALNRFKKAVAGVRELYSGRSIAILSHGTILALYTAMLAGEAPTLERWLAIDFAAVATVDLQTEKLISPFTVRPYENVPVRSSSG